MCQTRDPALKHHCLPVPLPALLGAAAELQCGATSSLGPAFPFFPLWNPCKWCFSQEFQWSSSPRPVQLLPLQAFHLFLGHWAAWNWFPLPCQEWEAPWQPPRCFHAAVPGHRLDSCLLHGRSLVISIRYVTGTRGNVSSVIYLLALEPLPAPRARHIMSLAFLHSHSLPCFLWLLIKPSKGYFQRGEAAAGPVPCRAGWSIPAGRARLCSPSLSMSWVTSALPAHFQEPGNSLCSTAQCPGQP